MSPVKATQGKGSKNYAEKGASTLHLGYLKRGKTCSNQLLRQFGAILFTSLLAKSCPPRLPNLPNLAIKKATEVSQNWTHRSKKEQVKCSFWAQRIGRREAPQGSRGWPKPFLGNGL